MFAHERRRHILDLVERRQRIPVADLQAELAVSAATLRRDLSELEHAGGLVRVHGGVMHPAALSGEANLEEKRSSAIPAKRAIAEAVACRIPDGATVFLDAGSTALEAARLLAGRSGLTLFTNSIPVLLLHPVARAKMIALGGEIRPISGALTGALALSWVDALRADFAVLGASALSLEEGACTTELTEAAVKQAMIRRSGAVYLVADRRKWTMEAPVRFASWNAFHAVFSDSPAPAGAAAVLEEAGSQLISVHT